MRIDAETAQAGRGIARALLAAAFSQLRRRGETVVRLDVDAQNVTGALRVYEAAGMHAQAPLRGDGEASRLMSHAARDGLLRPCRAHREPATCRTLVSLLAGSDLVLTEAAVVERLRREFRLPAHAQLVYGHAPFEPRGREALRCVYREYIAVAHRASLPLLLTSSTRRSNQETLAAAGEESRSFAREWVAFLRSVRGDDAGVFIGALLGSRGDAYRPQEALPAAAACAFHAPQCQAFAEAGAEFLLAATLPAVSEAQGLAKAMTETGLPFLVSFVIESSGRLLDGTPLCAAIETIDAVAPPTGYLVNCTHPENLLAGLATEVNRDRTSLSRLRGIQANASRLSPLELDGSEALRSDGSDALARGMAELRTRHGLRIFGGCCGTDAAYLEAIGAAVTAAHA